MSDGEEGEWARCPCLAPSYWMKPLQCFQTSWPPWGLRQPWVLTFCPGVSVLVSEGQPCSTRIEPHWGDMAWEVGPAWAQN